MHLLVCELRRFQNARCSDKNIYFFLCFVDRASRCKRVKKTQLVAQHILSIFRQPVHGSFSGRTTDSHLKRIISANCCLHTVVPPDDGHRYARNV